MYKSWKLGACLPAFASCADRYCLGGYGRGGKTMEEMLDMAKKVDLTARVRDGKLNWQAPAGRWRWCGRTSRWPARSAIR